MDRFMEALVLEAVGEPLLIKRIPILSLGADQALVRVKAAAFNRRDWWIQRGQYAGLKFPIVLGSDGAGVVESVGDDAHAEWIGKEVIINPTLNWTNDAEVQPPGFQILGLPENGTFAEYVAVPVANLYAKPAHLSFVEAASIPLGGLTSFRALFRKARLQSGEKLLITGVGGGVATFALQWGVAAGAEVFVTSGSLAKIERAVQAGAKGGVDYTDKDWASQLGEMAGGGFDVIVDSALGDGFSHFLELANPGGRIVFFGGTSGNLPALNGRKIFWKQLQILGTTMGSSVDFEHMLSFVDQHQIKPLVDSVIPWHRAQEGIYKMSSSSQFGKIVLQF